MERTLLFDASIGALVLASYFRSHGDATMRAACWIVAAVFFVGAILASGQEKSK